jgi:pSer/pThr/pTyr-binding forkhead associated (FHA) protein
MGVRLTVTMKGEAGAAARVETVTLDEDTFTLGRDPTCRVVLGQQAVSRTHARISRDGGLSFVEDLGSSFGTQLNGRALPKGEKRLLQRGDVIAIATFDVTFLGEADLEVVPAEATSFHSKRAVKQVMRTLAQGGANAYFRVMNGPTEGQHIEFSEGQEYIFGRDEATADVVLGDDLVSRRHAKVRRDWSGVHLEDLQSRNGVKVNRKRIQRSTLKDRDEVEIGGVHFLFLDPAEVREVAAPPPPPAPAPVPERQPAPAPPAAARRTEPLPPTVVAPLEAVHAEPEQPAAPPEEPPPDEEAAEPGPGRVIDLSNRQTLVALAVGAVIFLVGLVLAILVLAGA